MKFVCSFLCRFSVIALVVISSSLLFAQEDSGGAKIGTLNVTVYYATDGDPAAAGERAQPISETTKTSLSATEGLKFNHYRAMGADAKPIFKSYENWAQPLKPADEILIRFETRLEHTENEIPLNLDLWLTRKKSSQIGHHPQTRPTPLHPRTRVERRAIDHRRRACTEITFAPYFYS